MLYSENKVLNHLTNGVDAHDLHHDALRSSKVSKRQDNFSNISLSKFFFCYPVDLYGHSEG